MSAFSETISQLSEELIELGSVKILRHEVTDIFIGAYLLNAEVVVCNAFLHP